MGATKHISGVSIEDCEWLTLFAIFGSPPAFVIHGPCVIAVVDLSQGMGSRHSISELPRHHQVILLEYLVEPCLAGPYIIGILIPQLRQYLLRAPQRL